MGELECVVSNLVQMLDKGQKEAKTLVDTIASLQGYLEEESTAIVHASLDQLLSTIRMEADKITWGSVVVLISPEGRVTVDKTHSDEDSDPYLRRLKSQDFYILTLSQVSYFIHSLKSQLAEGNLIPVIEFLRANTESQWTPVYSPSPAVRKAERGGEISAPSGWKLADFLPALPPYPPLPRGLFRD